MPFGSMEPRRCYGFRRSSTNERRRNFIIALSVRASNPLYVSFGDGGAVGGRVDIEARRVPRFNRIYRSRRGEIIIFSSTVNARPLALLTGDTDRGRCKMSFDDATNFIDHADTRVHAGRPPCLYFSVSRRRRCGVRPLLN